MFTTFMVPLLSLLPIKRHFQKYLLHEVAKNSYTLVLSVCIINHYLNKQKKLFFMFSNYTFSNLNFFIIFVLIFFLKKNSF